MNIPVLLAISALIIWCLGVIVGCICRVNQLVPSQHRVGWRLYYTAVAGFSGAVAVTTVQNLGALVVEFQQATDAAVIDRLGDPHFWCLIAGLSVVTANLLLTRRLWKNGPPATMRKQSAMQRPVMLRRGPDRRKSMKVEA